MLTWKREDRGMAFELDGAPVGVAVAAPGTRDRFIPVEDNVICWERAVDAPTEEMEMRFRHFGEAVYTMIPAVQYDGNRCMIKDYRDVRNESPLVEKKEDALGPTYYVGDREAPGGAPHVIPFRCSSIPGATYSENGRTALGMFMPPDCMNGACSLYAEGGDTWHACLWPEQAGARRVFHDGAWTDRLRIPGERRTVFRAMLVFAAVERPRTAWRALLDAAWAQNYALWTPARAQDELWDLGVDYAKRLYTEEDDGFRGFSIGFTWNGEAWVKRDIQKYEIGWCGQNASLAVSLLTHALRTGDAVARAQGFAVLDAWVRATKPTGLIPTHYDSNMYTNGFGKTVDACNLGAAAVQLFEAEDIAGALGSPRPEYGAAARAICEFALRVMKPSGQIGKSWLEADLTPAVEDGTTGAFLTWALAVYAGRCGREDVRGAAERSLRFYARELSEKGYTTAGALDIFTIDKESCIPLLKCALTLHRLTGAQAYLDIAVDSACYLSTWQWCYDRPALPGSLFAQMGFRLFGGTAVSIHGGMDPYALFYVNDLIDLAELTGNPVWRQRAAAAWRHGQQGISDGTLALDGKAPRPRGSQDESESTAFGPHEDAPSQWLVAWPTAFRLETLRRWQTRDVHQFTRVL